jgi:hypothetical protein
MVRKSKPEKPYRLPPIKGELGERLQRALYVYNGKKGAVITKTIEDMIENELNYGFLADSDKKARDYGDEFWEEFDPSTSFVVEATTQANLRGISDTIVYEVIDNSELYTYGKTSTKLLNRFIETAFEDLMNEGILKKIKVTDNLLKTWRGKLSETNRLTNKNGTSFWFVNNENFTEITPENKALYDDRISARGLLGFKIKIDNQSQILTNINIGEKLNYKQFCKKTGLKGKRAEEVLDKLQVSGDMQRLKNGKWIRTDPSVTDMNKFNKIVGIGD